MALNVGELAVELEARTREFTSRMRGAERRIERFERQAGASTKAAGLSFRSLLGPLAAIGAALVAIGAARALAGITKGAVQSAAAFEGYEVRLKALLGSQEAANKSLDTFLKLSSQTPFGIAQIVSGAATLASVAKGSRTELESLTETTANLAAVTGLKFEEAAGNLQRALAAGIGAADLFRDRGVRKLIEEVNGIPDLTKVSLEELRELFKKTFAPGALSGFGTAAVELSLTLGGALSNIDDSLERFRIQLGQALSPAVIATARGVIIPFFDELTGKVEDNKLELQELFIEGFAKGAEIIANMIEALGPLGIGFIRTTKRVGELSDEAKTAFDAVFLFIKALATGFQLLGTGLNTAGAAMRILANLLGLRTAEEVEEQFLALNDSVNKTVDAAVDLRESWERFGEDSREDIDETSDAVDGLAAKVRATAGEIRRIGAEQIVLARQRAAAEDEAVGGGLGGAAAGLLSPAELKALAKRREAQQAIAEAGARYDAIIVGGLETAGEGFAVLTEDAAGFFADSMTDGLIGLAEGEGVEAFAESLAQTSADWLDEALRAVLEDLGQSFAKLLSSLGDGGEGGGGGFLSGIFGGGGEGGGLFGGQTAGESGADWGAGASAAIGLGGSILAGALRGTDVSVRNPAIRSAITSTQAVRGIVAGPSAIPIAQVGDAIRDAQGEQVSEIRRSNALLASILEAVRAGGGGTIDAGEALANAVAAEMTGSVALG